MVLFGSESEMPTYTCTYQSGRIKALDRAGLANVIARTHSEVTGAPLYFAQVIFNEVPSGYQFIGGNPAHLDQIFVFGHIRAGRSTIDRRTLIKKLTADIAKEAGIDTLSVWIYIHELPPTAMVEFGHILPEPGDEEVWTDSLPTDEVARMRSTARRSD